MKKKNSFWGGVQKIQSPEERLIEVDTVILNTSQRGCELLRSGAPISEVDSVTEFLRNLYRRREVILTEVAKAGMSEKQIYDKIRGKDGGGPRYELGRYMVQSEM